MVASHVPAVAVVPEQACFYSRTHPGPSARSWIDRRYLPRQPASQPARRRETAEETRWNANLLPWRSPQAWIGPETWGTRSPVAPPTCLPPGQRETLTSTYTLLHVHALQSRGPNSKIGSGQMGSKECCWLLPVQPHIQPQTHLHAAKLSGGPGQRCRSSGTSAVPATNLVSVASRWYPSESSSPQGARAERGTLSRCLCTWRARSRRKRYKYLAQFGVASHLTSTISLTSHPRHYLVLPYLLSLTACPLSLHLCPHHRQSVKSIFACFSTSLVRPR